MKQYRYLIVIYSLLVSLIGQAQDTNIPASHQFEIFELPGDELGNHVQTIAQDSFGFMWFGSQNGLHRWDGYNFKTYKHDPKDSTTIASDYIETIYVGKDGALWLGTWGAGLDRFDYQTQTFEHFRYQADNLNSISNDFISDIVEDNSENLWVATNRGLTRMNLTTQVIKRYLADSSQTNSLSYEKCRVLYVDRSDDLWIGTGYPWEMIEAGGLNRYRPETDDFEVYLKDKQNPQSIGDNKIGALFEDSWGNFWIGTASAQLYRMDRAKGTFLNIQQDSSVLGKLRPPSRPTHFDRVVKFIFEDQERRLWTGVWHGGIRYLEPETGFSRAYYHDDTDAKSLPEPNPWQLFQSKDGTLWGSTAGMSARVFKIEEKLFDHYRMPEGEFVTSFTETSSKDILLGTFKEGIKVFSPEKRTIQTIDFQIPTRPSQLKAFLKERSQGNFLLESWVDAVYEIVIDAEGWYWLRQPLNGAVRLNPQTGEVRFYQHQANNANSLGKGWVTDIHLDRKKRVWLLTSNGDLQRYNTATNDFERFPFYKEKPVYTLMLESAEGLFYLAGNSIIPEDRATVIKTFDPNRKAFSEIPVQLKPAVYESPINESILNILEGPDNRIWIATEERILTIGKEDQKVCEYNAFNYGAKRLQGMVIDKLGRLWLMGGSLILFDIKSGNKEWFKSNSNLNELAKFNQTIFMDQAGIIYLGGDDGFLRFDPLDIGLPKENTPPETIFSSLYLLNEEERKDFRFHPAMDDVTFSHKQNDFSIRFAAIDFRNPSANRHQYQLEGYDKQWRDAGWEPTATYVKVPPGHYTLKVRGAGETGDWGPEGTIKLYIAPPWWHTNLAYVIFALLLLSLVYVIYRYQLNRSLEQAEALRLKELDIVKTKLYTNITHEFRTPLTVISGMTTQIKEQPEEWLHQGLEMIERSSQRLLELVNQMLDLNKLESGKLQLSLQQGDMVSFLQYIVDSIHSLAEHRNIQVHFYAEEDEVWMDYDAEKIQQIITNLLTNAIKFSPQNGHIYLTTTIVSETGESSIDKQLQITLRDTGVGISEDQLPFIFDRFYQVDDTSTRKADGSGIGLALVKELVELMQGTISVKSKEGKGTEFRLQLPIEQKQAIQRTVYQSNAPSEHLATPQTKNNGVFPTIADKKRTDLAQVLIIEDHSDVVAYIAACLSGQYRVLVAKDGAEGIEMALQHTPDLIITDVMMPYKNGFEVCQTLKNEERSSHIPIIMLTAKADIESKLQGYNQGADAYLAKPFDKKELLVRIKNLLENRQKLQTYYRNLVISTPEKSPENSNKQLSNLEDVFVQKVNQIIEKYLDDFNFDVEKLSKEVHLSHSQLHRKLSALTGLSANRYIRHVRLHKAKDLLKDPEVTITAVAFDTGFSDPSYFGRVFKKAFQQTPKEYQTAQSR